MLHNALITILVLAACVPLTLLVVFITLLTKHEFDETNLFPIYAGLWIVSMLVCCEMQWLSVAY